MRNRFLPYGMHEVTLTDAWRTIKRLMSRAITQGEEVPKFEKDICQKTNAQYALATNSATSSLHLACLALGFKRGDLLWTSPITFVASANCARMCGGDIDFVDINERDGLMCVKELEKKLIEAKYIGRLPKIVIPVHLAGSSCDMKEIHRLSKKYGFNIIEDASHAIGGIYKKSMIGSCKYSDICVFSFHPVKIITTGEGGALTTNSKHLAQKLELLRSHGITKRKEEFVGEDIREWTYEQQILGYNYRMCDINAALGRSQLKRLKKIVDRRNNIAEEYKELSKEMGLKWLEVSSTNRSTYHLMVLRLCQNDSNLQKRLFNKLREAGIGAQVHYLPVHLQPYYKELGFKKGDFPAAERYANDSISLPIYKKLRRRDIRYVLEVINREINE